ncbi:MAG: 50S ribosomal protein L9 [Spirochaetes bacterium]|nr:50S ribosomal protein L9 [Spirochaetota bacterium]
MKVILNKDLSTLGEEGDVKDVAKGYARNYLFPKGIALPYTPKNVKLFESRKGEIDARKAVKRQDAMGLKEKLETAEIVISMSAGANGRLYGAVTSQTIVDELGKMGIQIERKRVEITSGSIKSVGKYKATVKLYEQNVAEIQISVNALAVKIESPVTQARGGARRRRDDFPRQDALGTALPESVLEAESAAQEPGAEPAAAQEPATQESAESAEPRV